MPSSDCRIGVAVQNEIISNAMLYPKLFWSPCDMILNILYEIISLLIWKDTKSYRILHELKKAFYRDYPIGASEPPHPLPKKIKHIDHFCCLFLRRLKSRLTRSLRWRVRCDLRRLKNRLQLPIPFYVPPKSSYTRAFYLTCRCVEITNIGRIRIH